MRNFISTAVALILTLSFNTAFALSLSEARKQKLVKELDTGYIKATDPKAQALADDVNKKRKVAYKKAYSKLTADEKKKVTLDDIGKRAAKKIKSKLKK